MENEETRAKIKRELCLNDPNVLAGDSRTVGSLDSYEDGHYDRKGSQSDGGRIVEVLEPPEMIEKLGLEMKDDFSGWSEAFLYSKNLDEEFLKRMDELIKEAYLLEAEFLEKLEDIKKRSNE